MSIELPVVAANLCWQRIGAWGDRSCPELIAATHCHNCSVFAAAGRRFLDAPSPPGYLEEWTERLGMPDEDEAGKKLSVLVFRLGEEWLALPVAVLMEVTTVRPPHRIPHRSGLLAGMVNIRGELHLCVRLDLLLGIAPLEEPNDGRNRRLIVIRRDAEVWVFAADEVDQVHQLPARQVNAAAPTLSRSHTRLNSGVLTVNERAVGLLDDGKLFHAIREQTR